MNANASIIKKHVWFLGARPMESHPELSGRGGELVAVPEANGPNIKTYNGL